MGGKTATTTQTVRIPEEVLARYNAVNARAEAVAAQGFQPYQGQFVAGLTPSQLAGMQNINQASGMAQPYYQQAAGYTTSGAQDVGKLTAQDIQQYYNPYTESVINPTMQALREQQGQERSGAIANAIRQGAFGGDRSGIGMAQLARQQNLASAMTEGQLRQGAYNQALQTAAGQQGVVASDLARRMQAGQQMAALGAGSQAAALQGGQAQMAAGLQQQQTQQADLTAQYQQFLQERGFPYQQAQFLANIAMGTGALSGSTTTTTQPAPFFSDRRLKHDVKEIGETKDGLPIYSFKYNGDDRTQIGLMAQDVEKKKPEAVGLAAGFKTVDYEKATENSGRKKREYGGGLLGDSMGGAVMPEDYAEEFATGGLVASPEWLRTYMKGIGTEGPGVYGMKDVLGAGAIGAPTGIPAAKIHVAKLLQAKGNVKPIKPVLGQAVDAYRTGRGIANTFSGLTGGLISSKENKSGAGLLAGLDSNTLEKIVGLLGGKASAFGGAREAEDDTPSIPGLPGSSSGSDPLAGVVQEGMIDVNKLPKPGENNSNVPKPPAPGNEIAGGLGLAKGLLGLFTLFSDERAKDNIRQVGELYNGEPVFAYNKLGGPTEIGLIAQEVLQRDPEAVIELPGGLLGVDYDLAVEMPEEAEIGLGAAVEAYRHGGAVGRHGYATDGYVPSEEDEDLAIRTIAAEMGGRSPEEAQGIANVIQNRLASGQWGKSLGDVVLAEGQFEPWMKPAGKNYPMKIDPEGPRYASAREAYNKRMEDVTGGALNFYAPKAQAALGRKPPRWAFEKDRVTPRPYLDIGPTRFVGVQPGLVTAQNLDNKPKAPKETALGAIKAATGDDSTGSYDSNVPGLSLAAVPVEEIYTGLVPKATFTEDDLGGTGVPATTDKPIPPRDIPDRPSSREPAAAPEPRPGVVPASIGRWSSVSDVAERFLPESVPTSSRFWVPTLSFLGSMLSSKSPYLAGAIGEGLVGGVAGYEANLKNQANLAKGVLDIVKDRFVQSYNPKTEQYEWFDKFNSRFISQEEFSKLAGILYSARGIDPRMGGITGAGAPQDVAGKLPKTVTYPSQDGKTVPAPIAPIVGVGTPAWMNVRPDKNPDFYNRSTAELRAYVEKHKDYYGLTGDKDPAEYRRRIDDLRKRAAAAMRSGNGADATKYENAANTAQKTLDSLLDQATREQVKNQREVASKRIAANSALFDKSGAGFTARQTALKEMKIIAGAMQKINTGIAANVNATVQEVARAIGIQIEDRPGMNAAEAQKILKGQWSLIFENLRQIGGQPRILEMQGLSAAGPEVTKNPGANRAVLANAMAKVKYADKYMRDAVEEKNRVGSHIFDESTFAREWVQKNKLDKFYKAELANNPLRGDVPRTSSGLFGGSGIDINKMKNGWQYILEPSDVVGLKKQFPKNSSLQRLPEGETARFLVRTDRNGRKQLIPLIPNQ